MEFCVIASKSVDAKHYSLALSISTILADPSVCVRHGAACGVSARDPYFPVAELRRKCRIYLRNGCRGKEVEN